MLESINIDSTIAVYVQIANYVQFAIASGRLKPGDKLPSMRELAEQLGIDMNTVERAYRDLEVMGLVSARQTMGVYVNKGVDAKCRERCRMQIIGRLHEVVAEGKAAGLSAAQVRDIIKRSYASASVDDPYGKVPKSVMGLGKRK
jgi:GntR family transcriptional regulator